MARDCEVASRKTGAFRVAASRRGYAVLLSTLPEVHLQVSRRWLSVHKRNACAWVMGWEERKTTRLSLGPIEMPWGFWVGQRKRQKEKKVQEKEEEPTTQEIEMQRCWCPSNVK